MRKLLLFILVTANLTVKGQDKQPASIFTDTSLYFIYQAIPDNPVSLSFEEIKETESLFFKAVEEYNRYYQHFLDSVNPTHKKYWSGRHRLNADSYFFQLVPKINDQGQKEVWINAVCKGTYIIKAGKKPVYDKDWKRKFTDGITKNDDFTCFLYLNVNLALKTNNGLKMNVGDNIFSQ